MIAFVLSRRRLGDSIPFRQPQVASPNQEFDTYQYGVIVPSAQSAAVVLGGADYVEPTIVGNLVQEDGLGGWVRNPGYDAPDQCPSFAILFPGQLKLSDPAFPAKAVTDYLEAVFPKIGRAHV